MSLILPTLSARVLLGIILIKRPTINIWMAKPNLHQCYGLFLSQGY